MSIDRSRDVGGCASPGSRTRPARHPHSIAARVGLAMIVLALVATLATVIVGPHAIAGYTSVTATTTVNIRSGPGTSYRILGVLYTGQGLPQAGSVKGGWVPVTYRSQVAYISAEYLSTGKVATPRAAKATSPAGRTGYPAQTTEALHLRTGPSLTSPSATVVGRGTALKVTGARQGDYSPVAYQGRQLWAASAYLSRSITSSEPLPTVGLSQGRATVALMARTSSDTSFTSTGDIPAGTIMTLTGVKENGVVQVIWQGALRWVNARFVAPVDSSTKVVAPPLPPVTGTRYATVALDIRTTSGSDSVTVTEVPSGTKLPITGVVKNGRAQVVWQGAVRWVTARYLTTEAPPTLGPNQGGVGLNALRPNAKKLVSVVFARYPQLRTIYGVRRDSLPDHPSGHAIDVMLPRGAADKELGWAMAQWLRANAASLHIQYIIFDQKIWNVSRDAEGWRPMSDRGSPTANHQDHVHITTLWD